MVHKDPLFQKKEIVTRVTKFLHKIKGKMWNIINSIARLGQPTDDDITIEIYNLISSAVGVSEVGLLEIVSRLPPSMNTQQVLILCIKASMSVRSQVEKYRAKYQITLPSDMMVDDQVNMSVLAQIGHIVMMVDGNRFTPFGQKKRVLYQKSIGGAANISKFERFRDGSSKRDLILKKYQEKISGFEISKFERVLVPIFPMVFTPSYASVAWKRVTSPFTGLAGYMWKTFNLLLMRLTYFAFYLLLLLFICNLRRD